MKNRMRTAVSIPDEVLKELERLARRVGRSRSEIISAALSEYVAKHAPDGVTVAIDRVIANVGDSHDPFSATAARPYSCGNRVVIGRSRDVQQKEAAEAASFVKNFGGRQEARTPDLRVANAALSQLS